MARRFVRAGLIPARAGSTIFSAKSYAPPGAHPRSRGEHGLVYEPHHLKKGSSPLARGAQPEYPGYL